MALKIIHIIPNLLKGGAQRLVLNICNELTNDEKTKVLLITYHSNNDFPFLTENLNWQIIPAKVQPSLRGKMIVEITKLQAAINAFQPDIIHSHLFEAEMVLSQINYPSAKYFVHFHDNMPQFDNLRLAGVFNKLKLTNFYEKRIVLKSYRKRSTTFISISEDTLRYMKKVLPREFKKIELPNAVDTQQFQPSANKPIENILVSIGGLWKKKGHQLAIETVAELKKRGTDICLEILGEGVLRDQLQKIIQLHSLEDSVFLRGNVDYPEHYLNAGKIYLHTASYEAFGLAIIEAMACGLPVICTDGKGNRDLILEGVNGFLVSLRNPNLLADKVEFLLDNEELRLEMGAKARKFSESFGIKNYCDKLMTLYISSLN